MPATFIRSLAACAAVSQIEPAQVHWHNYGLLEDFGQSPVTLISAHKAEGLKLLASTKGQADMESPAFGMRCFELF